MKGLTRHLDEIGDLGATAVWISPLQRQMASSVHAQAPAKLGIGEFRHWGFHGYWIDDFTALEPQFGTLDDLKALVDAAHQRGIKVLLDVVYNHAGYTSTYRSRRTASGETWLRPGEGDCEVDAVTCRVGGLPDFRTELLEVREHLLAANIELAKNAGVDGFRLDTYKHVETDFWLEHRKRTREQLGKEFFLLAEVWGGTAASLDPYFSRDEIDGGLDFSFKGSCEAFVLGRGRPVAYGNYLRSRYQVRSGYLLAHYLSSHDEPMALGNLNGDKERFRLCAAIQMTSGGVPVVYYGEEVARGGHEWPLNRNDMPWGPREVQPGKGIARDEDMRSFYKALIKLRRERPALTRGDYTLLSGPQEATLAYLRNDAASGDLVLVIVNRDDKAHAVALAAPPAWPAGVTPDALGSGTLTALDGRLQLEIAPKSVRIFAASARKASQ